MCCVGRKSQSLSSSLLRVLLSIFQPTCNDLDLSNLSDLAILYWVRFSPHLRTHIRLTSLDSQLANPNGSYLGHLQWLRFSPAAASNTGHQSMHPKMYSAHQNCKLLCFSTFSKNSFGRKLWLLSFQTPESFVQIGSASTTSTQLVLRITVYLFISQMTYLLFGHGGRKLVDGTVYSLVLRR